MPCISSDAEFCVAFIIVLLQLPMPFIIGRCDRCIRAPWPTSLDAMAFPVAGSVEAPQELTRWLVH